MNHLFRPIRASRPLADQIRCVEITMELPHVLVYPITRVDRQIAVQSVRLTLNVPEI